MSARTIATPLVLTIVAVLLLTSTSDHQVPAQQPRAKATAAAKSEATKKQPAAKDATTSDSARKLRIVAFGRIPTTAKSNAVARRSSGRKMGTP